MADTLRFSIVTPQGVTFNEPAELVTLPAVDGQIGVGPGHGRLITQIVPGEVIVTQNGQETYLAVGEGLVEITGDRVELLTDQAIPSDKVDEALAEAARERAAARLREKIADEEVATVNGEIARALAQLQVKRRRRS